MSDLYDTDIVLWSERQSELLRRRAAGELVNEAELDWPNIAEEIESVGSEQRHAVESLLMQALVHMLKAEAWPLSRYGVRTRKCSPCPVRANVAGPTVRFPVRQSLCPASHPALEFDGHDRHVR